MGFKIGNVLIKNQIIMAPVAGISTPSYMKIIESMGASLAFTELISAEAIARDNKKTFEMLNGIEKLTMPVGIQIFGSDAKTLATAAKILIKKYNCPIIDINMGCPVPKVALKNDAGSALLKNPDKIYDIVKTVVSSVSVPVTVKIRSGWDIDHINAVEVAKIIERAGASAISIHARTRSQGYSGKADWNIIKHVKENVSIPVIGNGDVTSPILAKKMLDETNCDGVMIGRGLFGNPWLVKECITYLEKNILLDPPSNLDKISLMKRHYELLKQDKNEHIALLEIRNNFLYYLKGMPNNKEIKSLICSCKSEEELLNVLNNYEEELKKIDY